MCLAKKSVQMPTKEEHGFLLFCGLGARKWQCDIDSNSLTFKQSILNIYPRLQSVIGYNLWTLTKDKQEFQRIPEKVNTPRKIRSYLGTRFNGCLLIVPVSDIILMEEKREHLKQSNAKQDREEKGKSSTGHFERNMKLRSLCLICGRIEKTPGTGSYFQIRDSKIFSTEGAPALAKKLTDILGYNFEQTSISKFIASDKICKKCFRAVSDVVKMEEQVKKCKENLVSSFLRTTSKIK